MLYLNRIDLATQEDIDNGLVYWAKMFNATTWEEIKSLSTYGEEFEEVAKVMYNSNVMDPERTILEAHQKYVMDKTTIYNSGYRRGQEEAKSELEAKDAEIAHLKELLNQSGITP